MTYRIVCWREGRIWSVMAPSVPGVFGTGKTEASARKDFERALAEMLDYLEDIGEPLPKSDILHVGSITVKKAS
jgi:predicted RNase H-like HicB family nuclease